MAMCVAYDMHRKHVCIISVLASSPNTYAIIGSVVEDACYMLCVFIDHSHYHILNRALRAINLKI